jgi:hypothetical protein
MYKAESKAGLSEKSDPGYFLQLFLSVSFNQVLSLGLFSSQNTTCGSSQLGADSLLDPADVSRLDGCGADIQV